MSPEQDKIEYPLLFSIWVLWVLGRHKYALNPRLLRLALPEWHIAHEAWLEA